MLDVIEDVRNEFEVKLTSKFEEEVIPFLNTNGGNIFIGVNDKESFEFFPNFIRVKFPYKENKFKSKKKLSIKNNSLTEIQNNIIGLMLDSPTINQETLASLLDVNIRTIQRNIKTLIDKELVERTGTNKKGEWIVKKMEKKI